MPCFIGCSLHYRRLHWCVLVDACSLRIVFCVSVCERVCCVSVSAANMLPHHRCHANARWSTPGHAATQALRARQQGCLRFTEQMTP